MNQYLISDCDFKEKYTPQRKKKLITEKERERERNKTIKSPHLSVWKFHTRYTSMPNTYLDRRREISSDWKIILLFNKLENPHTTKNIYTHSWHKRILKWASWVDFNFKYPCHLSLYWKKNNTKNVIDKV